MNILDWLFKKSKEESMETIWNEGVCRQTDKKWELFGIHPDNDFYWYKSFDGNKEYRALWYFKEKP